MIIIERINIFKLVRLPYLYDMIKFFKKIKENYNQQETNTKLNLNDYFEEKEEISQNITIIMVFNINSKVNNLRKNKDKLYKLSQNFLDKDFFN
jgi:hypothetical protein